VTDLDRFIIGTLAALVIGLWLIDWSGRKAP